MPRICGADIARVIALVQGRHGPHALISIGLARISGGLHIQPIAADIPAISVEVLAIVADVHTVIAQVATISSHVLSVGAKIPGVSMNVGAVLREIPAVGLNVGFVACDVALVVRTIALGGVIPAEISLGVSPISRYWLRTSACPSSGRDFC